MARHALVIGEALQRPQRHRAHVRQVRVEDARLLPIRRRRVIVRRPALHFPERLHALHHQRRFRQPPEILRQLHLHRIEIALGLLEIRRAPLSRIRQVELLVRPHELEERLLIALEPYLLADLVHLSMDALHLGEPQLVDPVRRHLGRRLQFQRCVVPLRPVRQRQRANLAGRRVRAIRLQPRDQPLVSRLHLFQQRRLRRLLPRFHLRRVALPADFSPPILPFTSSHSGESGPLSNGAPVMMFFASSAVRS